MIILSYDSFTIDKVLGYQGALGFFTFDDGMPLTCTNRNRAFLRGLHAKKLDPCSNGCPMMKFLNISDYLDWINARLAL